jgi:hypothetical protein
VALGAAGDVYVTSSGNNQVVKLAAGSGAQTTLPLTGLNNPWGAALDASGDVYVYFHNLATSFGLPGVFAVGNWTMDLEKDAKCPDRAMYHASQIAQFPLPTPPQNPIALLTGRGRSSATAAPCQVAIDTTINQTFTRTGD